MRFFFKFLVFFISLFFSFSAQSLTELIYSLPVDDSPVLIKKQVENVNIKINNFENKGFSSPDKALVTFFYLVRKDLKKEIIDMHYLPDGTRGYIRDMLSNDPEAFLGSKNLASITIQKIIYWGDKRIVDFSITDTNGNSADWQEKFICDDGRCYKSNANFFGKQDDKIAYFDVIQSYRNIFVASKSNISDEYESHDIYPNNNKKYPLQFLIKKSELNVNSLSFFEWYIKLSRLNELLKDNVYDLERMEKIEEYLQKNYVDWSAYEFLYPDFTGAGREKTFYKLSLFGLSRLELANYVNYKGYVWIFLKAISQHSPNDSSFYLMLYDEKQNKFVNEEYRENVELIALDSILRNKVVSELIFSANTKKNDFDVDVIASSVDGAPPMSKSINDSNFSSELIFFVVISILIIGAILFIVFYFRFFLKIFGLFKKK